ncbi:hypothetical protein [Parapedobacter sp. 2B3]|uniref:hypothetical protein n=1 Tax=Parapedobacter sp. 2B3 TaxID=3342381 RepID=UPI0035B61708
MNIPEFIPTRQLLDNPIKEQGIADPLKRFAESHGFRTLRELLDHSLQELLAMPGFSTECYRALIGFLERHQRLYLLQITSQA